MTYWSQLSWYTIHRLTASRSAASCTVINSPPVSVSIRFPFLMLPVEIAEIGVVSHAGMGILRELADLTGLSAQVTVALADTYKGPWVYAPGAVFADLAAAMADGADCIDGVGQLRGDREHVFGAAASTTTMWRLVDQRVDATHLPGVRTARASARAAASTTGAAPAPGGWLHIDIDATLKIIHSDNTENAAPTWKKTFGHHPLPAFLDRPEIAGGEALAGLLRAGNAGSNTAADHVTVLQLALASLPPDWRPGTHPGSPHVVVRSDSAGATHAFAKACHDHRVGFFFGHPVEARVQDAADTLNRGDAWYPAIESSGEIRDGAWVAEATDLVDLSAWPAGTRLILRKERPHPGAQLRFTDADGMRVTAFITDTAARRRRRTAGWPRAAAPPARPCGGLSRSSDYPDVFGLLLVVACLGGMDVGIIRVC